MDELTMALLSKPTAPAIPARKANPERDFSRSIEVDGDQVSVTIKAKAGEADESAATAYLRSKGEDPADWIATGFRSGEWTMANGELGESNRYTFTRSAALGKAIPIDELTAAIKRHRPKANRPTGDHGFLVVLGDMQFGKGLKSDTPILTTEGWAKHGDLRVGMSVFGADGQAKRVLDVLPTTTRALYEVTLGDGSVITCDEQHQWSGYRKVRQGGAWVARRMVIDLLELERITSQVAARERPFVLDAGEAVSMPERELPIEPHLFGMWLGDGASASGRISLGVEDRALIEALGPEIPSESKGGSMYGVRIPGLSTALNRLGVLGGKRVPEEYLRGSIDQRLQLVQGLMDTDGHTTDAGACEFTNTNKQIIDSMAFLLRSLGMRPRITEHVGRLGGVDKKTYWRVCFRATAPVFTLERKLSKLKDSTARQGLYRSVRSVRRVEDGDAQCITVEGGLYLAGEELVVTHNCDGDGVEGTLKRTVECLNAAADRLKAFRTLYDIGHVHIAWMGDHIEGFQSQGGANVWRTPLTLSEQIRLTRRVMLHAMVTFAPLVDRLTMAAVPGNHGETARFAGKGLTRHDDSHDTESLVAVADAAALSKAYDHVEFYVPETDEMTVVLDVAGTNVAHAHGHQWRPGKHFDWWRGQAFNQDSAMHMADVLLAGHLHHAHIESDTNRLYIGAPAMEQESTWWRHATGTGGSPGLITAVVRGGRVSLVDFVRAAE